MTGRRRSRYAEMGMNQVNIKRESLLVIVKTNREEHSALAKELESKYKEHVLKALRERLDQIEKGGPVNHVFNIKRPVNQTKDYDKMIRKLELCPDEVVQLTDAEFENYVQDSWHWTADILDQSSSYGISNATTAKYLSNTQDYS